MQAAGYFVLLIFVGLTSAELSILRVATRVSQLGHAVPEQKLRERFPRTQRAIAAAVDVADACLLADNSRDEAQAFTVCRVVVSGGETFDIRKDGARSVPKVIAQWLDVVCPLA